MAKKAAEVLYLISDGGSEYLSVDYIAFESEDGVLEYANDNISDSEAPITVRRVVIQESREMVLEKSDWTLH
jgi:hypothetical protein